MPRKTSKPALDPRVRALLSLGGNLTTTAVGIPYNQAAAARVDGAYRAWESPSQSAPFRDVPIASLRALQTKLGPETVTHFLQHPTAPADTAVMVLRFDGHDYVTNGHHRVAAAKLRGDRTIRARFLDVGATASPFRRGDLRAMAMARAAAERKRDAAGINGAESLHEAVRHHYELVRALDRDQRAEYDRHYREARAVRPNGGRAERGKIAGMDLPTLRVRGIGTVLIDRKEGVLRPSTPTARRKLGLSSRAARSFDKSDAARLERYKIEEVVSKRYGTPKGGWFWSGNAY